MYSSIFSAVINIILKQLSLSDNNILKLKQENNYQVANKNSKTIYFCLNFKFIIFYFLCLIFMSFFWYFISCFCAVFSNTQIILIKDTAFETVSFVPKYTATAETTARPEHMSCLILRPKKTPSVYSRMSLLMFISMNEPPYKPIMSWMMRSEPLTKPSKTSILKTTLTTYPHTICIGSNVVSIAVGEDAA